jgi:hypothetical protein
MFSGQAGKGGSNDSSGGQKENQGAPGGAKPPGGPTL